MVEGRREKEKNLGAIWEKGKVPFARKGEGRGGKQRKGRRGGKRGKERRASAAFRRRGGGDSPTPGGG